MGLFSFLFSKHKLLRTTYEAETFRAVFREDEELFLRVEKGEELKRYRELEEYVNSLSLRKDGKKSNSSLIRTANIIKQNGNIKLCSRCVSYNLIC